MISAISSSSAASLNPTDLRPGGMDTTGRNIATQRRDVPEAPAREPAPVPVPSPDTNVESFAAALAAQHIPQNSITPGELQLRLGSGWHAPDSPLRLADITV